MDKVLQFCSSLSSLFVELVQEQDNIRTETLASIKKQGQYLASCLKHAPEVLEQPDVLETLAIYSEVSPIVDQKIFAPCNEVIQLCLNTLTTSKLAEIWYLSEDISLCAEASKLCTIKTDHYMKNIHKWIEDYRGESTYFLRYIAAIKSNISDPPTIQQISSIIPYLIDHQAVKCAMATAFLRTFKKINHRISSEIVAAWLSTTNHTPQNAYCIRLLLSSSSEKFLVYLSSLCLEFPSIFAILPLRTSGLATLARLSVHRTKVFSPELVPKLLSCCDSKIRLMFPEFSEDISSPLRILDSISDSRPSIGPLFDSVGSLDLYAACLMFARDTSLQNGNFISSEIRSEILSVLTKPEETVCDPIHDITDSFSQSSILDNLSNNKINEVLKTAPGIVI